MRQDTHDELTPAAEDGIASYLLGLSSVDIELFEGSSQMLLHGGFHEHGIGRRHHVLLELVREMEVVLLINDSGQGDVVVGDLEQRGDLGDRHLQLLCNLLCGRVALQLDGELRDRLADPIQEVGLLLR